MRSLTLKLILAVSLLSTGCGSLLPKKYTVTHKQWTDYDQVLYIGTNIRAGQTLEELKTLGVDVYKTNNIQHLTHLDVAEKFGLLGFKDDGIKTPAGVQ